MTYQAAYEAFGRHGDTASSQEWGSTEDRQQANTKDEDPTGLLNEGFRYRDLETGTFITRDPLGFIDGPNTYTYVVQNPWTMFDPRGLKYKYDYKEVNDDDSDAERSAKEDYNARLKEIEDKHNEIRDSDYYEGSVVQRIDQDEKNTVVVHASEKTDKDGRPYSYYDNSQFSTDEDGNSTAHIYISEKSGEYISDDSGMKDQYDINANYTYTQSSIAEEFIHESVHAFDHIHDPKAFMGWMRQNKQVPAGQMLAYPNMVEYRAVQEANKYRESIGKALRVRYDAPGPISAYVAERDPDPETRRRASLRHQGYMKQAFDRLHIYNKNPGTQ